MSIIDRITDQLLAEAVSGMAKVSAALADAPDTRLCELGLTESERHAIYALAMPVRMGGCLRCGKEADE